MPDYGQQQFGQPNIPVPQAYVPDYSYLSQSNNLNYQGSGMENTLLVAQQRMNNHLQTVLAGSMQAGMQVYQTYASTTAKMHERSYNDMNLGGGNFVLERSMSRDLATLTGVSQSSLGRALRIGGRKPEWLSEGEYAFQQSRSAHHRLGELGDMGISGGFAAAGMLVGGPLGLVGGLIAGQVAGFASDAINAKRIYTRDISSFAEVTNLNQGIGQRRMSGATAEALADRFYRHDNPLATNIPLIGDRFRPDTQYSDTLKKMGASGLLNRSNLNDVDELEKTVKETTKFVEKYAGVLKMAKDDVLKLKGSLNSMGFNGTQQDIAIGQISRTSLATGMSGDQVSNFFMQSSYAGFGLGYGAQTSGISGVRELASINALREAGVINKMYDPATLAMQRQQTNFQFGNTNEGMAMAFGGATPGGTRDFLRGVGGNDKMGYLLYKSGIYEKNVGSQELFNQSFDALEKKLGRDKALKYFLSRGNKELADQAFQRSTGLDTLGSRNSEIAVYSGLVEREGRSDDLASVTLSGKDSKFSFYSSAFGSSKETTDERNNVVGLLDKMGSTSFSADENKVLDRLQKRLKSEKWNFGNGNFSTESMNSQLAKLDQYAIDAGADEKQARRFSLGVLNRKAYKDEILKKRDNLNIMSGDLSSFMKNSDYDSNVSIPGVGITSEGAAKIARGLQTGDTKAVANLVKQIVNGGNQEAIMRLGLGPDNQITDDTLTVIGSLAKTTLARDKNFVANVNKNEKAERLAQTLYEQVYKGKGSLEEYKGKLEGAVNRVREFGLAASGKSDVTVEKYMTGYSKDQFSQDLQLMGYDGSRMSGLYGMGQTGTSYIGKTFGDDNFNLAALNKEQKDRVSDEASGLADEKMSREALDNLSKACWAIATSLGAKPEQAGTKQGGAKQAGN